MTGQRFVEDASWNAFGMALAGVFAVVLMPFVAFVPGCTSGMPFLPHIAEASIVAPGTADLRVLVTREGGAYIDGEWGFSSSTFGERLDRSLASPRYRRLIVRADRAARYGTLLPILRAAQTHHIPVVFANRAESILERIEIDGMATLTK